MCFDFSSQVNMLLNKLFYKNSYMLCFEYIYYCKRFSIWISFWNNYFKMGKMVNETNRRNQKSSFRVKESKVWLWGIETLWACGRITVFSAIKWSKYCNKLVTSIRLLICESASVYLYQYPIRIGLYFTVFTPQTILWQMQNYDKAQKGSP